ncbi:MAG: hypothetical protein LC799_05920 [Actinobacteria bacterium]|nr:hypothetical protein [Actinomycetota bacterium]
MSGKDEQLGATRVLRALAAIAVFLLVAAYTTALVSGAIGEEDRIDAVALALMGLAALCMVVLLQPDALRRLRLFEMGGFKLEMLEQVKERQDEHAHQLEDIALILPILLPETERRHLLNLSEGNTQGYRGGDAARTELRRLRSIGLIRMRPDHNVSDMRSDRTFDLSDYVELTELGERWVGRIRQIEQLHPQRGGRRPSADESS